MPTTAKTDAEFLDRFWAKVDKTPTCWNWTGALTTAGYGSLRHRGQTLYAHRVSHERQRGPIPEGLLICHICDNRRCVNPDRYAAGGISQSALAAIYGVSQMTICQVIRRTTWRRVT